MTASKSAQARVRAEACCTEAAGASPARVIAGEPDSRPQAEGETLVARAGRRKPSLWRKQESGPQLEVKPTASSNLQGGSRAGHVAAKATPAAPVPERAAGFSGVWGAARSYGSVRNRRGPSARPARDWCRMWRNHRSRRPVRGEARQRSPSLAASSGLPRQLPPARLRRHFPVNIFIIETDWRSAPAEDLRKRISRILSPPSRRRR